MERLSLTSLRGWAEDDHEAALAAYLKTAKPGDPAFDVAPGAARAFFEERFEAEVVSAGAVLTGYFEPEYAGALQPDERFRFPVYASPEGWKQGELFATRAEIEAGALLAGGPSKSGMVSQNSGWRRTSPRVQWRPFIPDVGVSLATDGGVRAAFSKTTSKGSAARVSKAATTQSQRQPTKPSAKTKRTGSAACPIADPREAIERALPRLPTNQRAMATIERWLKSPCPKRRSAKMTWIAGYFLFAAASVTFGLSTARKTLPRST